MKQEYFKELYEVTKKEEGISNQKFNQISAIRLGAFAALLVGVAIGMIDNILWGYILAAISFIGFIYFMNLHNKVENKRKLIQSKKFVVEQYLSRFTNQWHEFKENGELYFTDDYPQAKDLDLLGRNSLYQYINTANTTYGKKILAEYLTLDNPIISETKLRQEAVWELAGQKNFSILLQTLSNLLKADKKSYQEEELDQFLTQVENSGNKYIFSYKLLAWGVPAITLIVLVLSFFNLIPYWGVAVCIMVQLGITGASYVKNTSILNPVFSFQRNIEAYEKIFKELEEAQFQCKLLVDLQASLKQGVGAYKSIKHLGTIGEAIKIRFNPIIHGIVNGTIMWDYHCVLSFDKWKVTYGKRVRKWLVAVGEIEALLSLSVLCHVKEEYCRPELIESKTPKFRAIQLSHVLIPEDKAIANSIELNGKTCIITGSNMSGKTTFLRSIGVNLMLAYAGAPVCGDSFEASAMSIFTSMRVEDDVSKGISTFYAEILRIKTMVQFSGKKQGMLVLIDEIFKGTNSADRIIGATETIKRLSKPWINCMVSTHDFELCNLEASGGMKAVNYHFSEYYIKDEIQFDYVMREGRCQTTNAQHLLRLAGIMGEGC